LCERTLFVLVLEEVLEQREHRLRSRVIRECLVRWRGGDFQWRMPHGREGIYCSTQG
jgi:hypothetical protein